MVVLSKPTIADFPPIINCKSTTLFPVIPTVDLSEPDSKHLVVKSCEEFGFFKVINHGIPLELISRLETEVIEFFSLSLSEKQKAGPPDPFGYGNRSIGPNGDVGWVEYLLLTMNQERNSQKLATIFGKYPEKLWWEIWAAQTDSQFFLFNCTEAFGFAVAVLHWMIMCQLLKRWLASFLN